ncbi:hypothetical protein HOK51_02595 [Candidatus Woesearchaeota archaeon]|jgi:hypothetical protein|nr:hypothetical protein [Candidatus Woesearchaeota archaeon]MBT6518707.1 hypothetical protein [Candidatus Woesearchaeota archaeon]MBT7368371.1 hypothetical protein [Candidatus Woesearchaeota archaeon]
MTDKTKLGAEIIKATMNGDMDSAAMVAAFSVLSGGPLLKPSATREKKATGLDAICNTQDSQGNVLVAGTNYQLRGQKVKVLREQFGGGNMMDTYFRIFYLGSDLEEHFECVDAKYSRGVLNGPIYKSQFDPIKEK